MARPCHWHCARRFHTNPCRLQWAAPATARRHRRTTLSAHTKVPLRQRDSFYKPVEQVSASKDSHALQRASGHRLALAVHSPTQRSRCVTTSFAHILPTRRSKCPQAPKTCRIGTLRCFPTIGSVDQRGFDGSPDDRLLHHRRAAAATNSQEQAAPPSPQAMVEDSPEVVKPPLAAAPSGGEIQELARRIDSVEHHITSITQTSSRRYASSATSLTSSTTASLVSCSSSKT